MTRTDKLTKKDVVTMMLQDEYIAKNAIFVSYLENEKGILERKASKSGNSKLQQENETIKEQIINALYDFAKPVTVTELMKVVNYSNQKLTALLRQLVDAEKVTRVVDKKKSYFSIKGE